MNYYDKYIKYKHKYLNLLGKTKRSIGQREAEEKEEKEEKGEKEGEEDKSGIIDKVRKLEDTDRPTRDSVLAGLFKLFISEPIYERVYKYVDESADNQVTNLRKHSYNLRGREFRLRREDEHYYIGSYTPEIISKLKSDGISSSIIDELVKNFKIDDIANIEFLNNQNPLYVNFDNYGKNIECWVADNMCCPCCKQKTLRRYVKNNMPCIDLVCVNPAHKFAYGVKFFQVKAKSIAIRYPPHQNFDYDTKQIHTGSKAIGQYIHSIQPSGDYYALLIGYICIVYEKIIKEPNEIIRILSNSFIVLPKLHIDEAKKLFDADDTDDADNEEKKSDSNSSLELEKVNYSHHIYPELYNQLYYWYIDGIPMINTIEFSTTNNDVIFFTSQNKKLLFDSNCRMNFISTDYNPNLEHWVEITNPLVN